MTRKILLLGVFGALAYGFWVSPDFKTITAGVAIFLLGMLSLEQGFKAFSGGVLEGSMNHLRAFVLNIEKQIGEGNYKAQVLSQEEVDAILGR